MCVGVGTKVDPTLCRADRMVGQVGCVYRSCHNDIRSNSFC